MSDILSRAGLSAYSSTRVNAAPRDQARAMKAETPIAAEAAYPPNLSSCSTADRSAARPMRSSGKRDLATANATDVLNEVKGSPTNTADTRPQPAKKKKITYALPHQNMEEGHFYVVLGEDVDVSTERFKMLSLLGEGTFGKVVECWDRQLKKYCAVKIVRNVPKYTRDAKVEIEFMERLRAADPRDTYPIMKILRHFQNDSQHVCIVMNKYGPCMLDHMQRHGPLPHRFLAEVVFQCGVALDFFHSEMRLIHTDLKPENLLLESGATQVDPTTGRSVPTLPCKTRICDLGGCCDERHSRSAIVSTRHYRAPEVILGMGWMFSADCWSMGCIIYELFTGRLLYDTHDNLEHLHLMEKTLGRRLPHDWRSRCSEDTRSLFSATTGGPATVVDAKSTARIARARVVNDVIKDDDLKDLILGLLDYDKTRRYTARRMTTHPYVRRYFPESQTHPSHPNNRGPLPPPPTW